MIDEDKAEMAHQSSQKLRMLADGEIPKFLIEAELAVKGRRQVRLCANAHDQIERPFPWFSRPMAYGYARQLRNLSEHDFGLAK